MAKEKPLPPPLLLTLRGGDEAGKQSFYNLLENRYETTSLPILCDQNVLGSAYGWLVLVDPLDGDCCLWNPTSLEIIELPELEYPLSYNQCFLSKPPTETGCLVVFNRLFCTKQFIYRIGDDEDVEVFEQNSEGEGYRVHALVSIQGVIYGIREPGYEFVTIHIDGDVFETRPLLIDGERPLKVPQPKPCWVTLNMNYLIESSCGNELLLVTKMCFAGYLRNGVQFRVFRVNFSRMECEELENLDGRTIFIGYYGNGFCRSSESFGEAIKANSIYYTNSDGMAVYIYNLDDRSTITLLPSCPDDDIEPNKSQNYWVDFQTSWQILQVNKYS